MGAAAHRPPRHTAGLFAEFDRLEALRHAGEELRALGYSRFELYLPFPDEQSELAGHPRRPLLRWFVLAAGLVGGAAGYLVQWYCNAVDYPINVGGRPLHSAPAFVFITFESTILLAALMTFAALLVSARLGRLWDPVFEVEGFERATTDRFWVELAADDPRFDRLSSRGDLERLQPLRIVEQEASS